MSANAQKVRAYALRKKPEGDLNKQLASFKSELVHLRTSKVSSAAQVKLARIRVSIFSQFLKLNCFMFLVFINRSNCLLIKKMLLNLRDST